jgi:ubiquinone/menaquinone biosynthesis C-methylase UbiE
MWLLGDAQRVIEVGAGTGKLTDRLVDRDHVRLTVTEIDGRMLRLIGLRHPTLPLHEAGATNLPIADGTVDAVLVADAWHWFPKEEAATGRHAVERGHRCPSTRHGSDRSSWNDNR